MQSHAQMHTFNKIIALLRNEASQFHEGMMPFHLACCIAAPRDVSETLLELNADAVKSKTIYTKDTALHCYLKSNRSGISVTDSISTSTIQFLMKKIMKHYQNKTYLECCQSILQHIVTYLLTSFSN